MKLIIENIVTRKEAVQFNGNNYEECKEFIGEENFDNTLNYPNVKTLEGVMRVNVFDYIIKDVNGEFYPCKPDIFKKSYRVIEMTEGFLD